MASTDLPRVLRIPRSDNAEDNFILLHVSSTGRHLLDLKLIGTDNEAAFSAKVKHNRTSDLKTKNFPGTQAQWEKILAAILLGAAATEFTQDVEALATVVAETSITITIQKSIEGIKQRYGTIALAYTEDEEISLFDWCALTVQSKDESSGGLAGIQSQLKGKEEEVKSLNDKLAELVAAKQAYEDELVEKFSLLLNEKKLKIRDQLRLLAAANVDPAKLAEVKQARIPDRDSPPGPLRGGKRKAVKDESDEGTDDGFEKMDVDAETAEPAEPNSADEDERRTDDDESTADENSGDETFPRPLPSRDTSNAPASSSGTAMGEGVVPPKRDLPFSKKPAPKPAARAVDGSETESDDEL